MPTDSDKWNFRDSREKIVRYDKNEVTLLFDKEEAALAFRLWMLEVGRDQFEEWAQDQDQVK